MILKCDFVGFETMVNLRNVCCHSHEKVSTLEVLTCCHYALTQIFKKDQPVIKLTIERISKCAADSVHGPMETEYYSESTLTFCFLSSILKMLCEDSGHVHRERCSKQTSTECSHKMSEAELKKCSFTSAFPGSSSNCHVLSLRKSLQFSRIQEFKCQCILLNSKSCRSTYYQCFEFELQILTMCIVR